MRQSGSARERHLAQNLSGARRAGGRPALSNALFRPVTLISLVLISFFAFGAFIVLGGFAKDLRKTEPGQATPRSESAVGYKALRKYLERLDYDIEETRGKRNAYDRDSRLVIYTPPAPSPRIKKSLNNQGAETSLIILPKWSVSKMIPKKGEESRKGWARKNRGPGVYDGARYQRMLTDMPVIRRKEEASVNAQVVFINLKNQSLAERYEPDYKELQYFNLTERWKDHLRFLRQAREAEAEERRRKAAEERGEIYEPKKKKSKAKKNKKTEDETEPKPLPKPEVLMEINGQPVLIRLEDTKTYVLSDPDLVNTMAFKSQGGAQLASAIIDEIIDHAMVTPPFLAATLCLLAAGILVAWQGFNRFGDPARVKPDYAQGPVSLARTAAEFMGVANRAHSTGAEYAELIRRQVAAHLGYKDRATTHIDTLLDAREKRLKIQPPYEDLKTAISNADPLSYGQYAQALTTWRDAMTENGLGNPASLSGFHSQRSWQSHYWPDRHR